MKCTICNKEIKGKFHLVFNKPYCQDCTQTKTMYKFEEIIDRCDDWMDECEFETFENKEAYIRWLKSNIDYYKKHLGEVKDKWTRRKLYQGMEKYKKKLEEVENEM